MLNNDRSLYKMSKIYYYIQNKFLKIKDFLKHVYIKLNTENVKYDIIKKIK